MGLCLGRSGPDSSSAALAVILLTRAARIAVIHVAETKRAVQQLYVAPGAANSDAFRAALSGRPEPAREQAETFGQKLFRDHSESRSEPATAIAV